jgi:cation diffusion facilitator CzcD-associated flavoprotein CzcO
VYPGVRCDIPSNVYQSTFEPNTQWTEEYARGAEIEEYWKNVARKYGVYDMFHANRKVLRAEWSDTTAQWTLTIERMDTGGTFQESFDCIMTAIGRFNDWRLPQYPGMDEYQGLLRHASNWDPSFDPKGKNVAVIGNGASGLQVVPELQLVVNRLDHYARSRTWVAGSHDVKDRQFGPMYYSPEQLKDFEDPDKYLEYRRNREEPQWRKFEVIFRNQVANENQREQFTKVMAERLKDKPELLKEILPDFPPNCRRLTPGPGYLESLTKENVDYISTPIKRFTKTGIETEDGKHREVDAVICATGANIKGEMPFPIVSRGIDLNKAFQPGGHWGFPYTYMGVATPGFPNLTYIYGMKFFHAKLLCAVS